MQGLWCPSQPRRPSSQPKYAARISMCVWGLDPRFSLLFYTLASNCTACQTSLCFRGVFWDIPRVTAGLVCESAIEGLGVICGAVKLTPVRNERVTTQHARVPWNSPAGEANKGFPCLGLVDLYGGAGCNLLLIQRRQLAFRLRVKTMYACYGRRVGGEIHPRVVVVARDGNPRFARVFP